MYTLKIAIHFISLENYLATVIQVIKTTLKSKTRKKNMHKNQVLDFHIRESIASCCFALSD